MALPPGGRDGLTRRPWYRWCPRDFYADPAVMAMDREERWRYRDALDAAWNWDDPARGEETDWREAFDYSEEEWAAHRRHVLRVLVRLPDGRLEQKRLRLEYEHATEKSRRLSEAARQRSDANRRATDGRWT